MQFHKVVENGVHRAFPKRPGDHNVYVVVPADPERDRTSELVRLLMRVSELLEAELCG